MTIGAGGNYGNLKNSPGSDGAELLDAGIQIDFLGSLIQDELDKTVVYYVLQNFMTFFRIFLDGLEKEMMNLIYRNSYNHIMTGYIVKGFLGHNIISLHRITLIY